MRDLEVRAIESTDALENPRDPLADDRVGRIEGLREHADRLGGLPVFVRDATANALTTVWLRLDRPVELEPVLPAAARRRGDGRQCEQYGAERIDPAFGVMALAFRRPVVGYRQGS